MGGRVWREGKSELAGLIFQWKDKGRGVGSRSDGWGILCFVKGKGALMYVCSQHTPVCCPAQSMF